MRETEAIFYAIRIAGLTAFCGITEGLLIAESGTTGKKIIAGHFSLYHVFLLLFMLLFGLQFYEDNTVLTWYSLILWLPMIITNQDAISHFTTALKLREDLTFNRKWHKWPLNRLWWGLPYFYWLMFSLQIFFAVLYFGLKALGEW